MSQQTELNREQMIEHQVRAWEVLDERVLSILRKVPREKFVPAEHAGLAFADDEVPLPHGQHMERPGVAGRLLQALGLTGGERVLEIGTGSGFLTACLAAGAASVRSVELFADLADTAAANLKRQGVLNVQVIAADAASDEAHASGGPLDSQFDAILFSAALPVPDLRFQQLLADGGRLLVAIGEGPVQEVLRITRAPGGEFIQDSLFETSLDPLLNARRPARFEF